MLRPKLLFFLYYAAMASLLPFLVLHYRSVGLTGQEIGVLTGLIPLLAFLASPLWSALADSTQRYRAILVVAIGGALLAVIALRYAVTYSQLMAVTLIFAILIAPVAPLLDFTVLTRLGTQKAAYGGLRVWGAVGWGLAAPLAGILAERAGLARAFDLALLLLLLLTLMLFTFPVDRGVKIATSAWTFRPFINRRWLLFLFAAFMGGIGLAVSSTFLYLYMADLEIDKRLIGLSLSVATVSELPVMVLARRWLKRWSAQTLLTAALFAFALRLALYSLGDVAWVFLTVQLLHGATFSLMLVAGVAYADEIAPVARGATAQGLFSAMLLGAGSFTGALVGGFFYDNAGATRMFQYAAACLAIGGVLLLVTRRVSTLQSPAQKSTHTYVEESNRR